ncbi:hypothetical protein COOONC_07797, partial [Cooperia oncophora]
LFRIFHFHFLGAICYIELGTSITEPGCDFAYTVYVGWKAIAFAFMWVSVFVTYPASAAVQAMTFGQYIVNGMEPVWSLGPEWHEFMERALGYTLLVVLIVLNFYALDRYAAPFQVAVTSAKMLAMAIIVFAGFYYLFFEGWSKNLEHPMAGSVWAPGKLTLAFYGGLWSYAGWDILNYGTPEIEKPTRTMPLSLITGILIVCITYVAINISYFIVLTPDEMKNSTAVAADFAQKTLGNFSYAIPFMVALLLIGTLNSNPFLRITMICTFAMSFVDIDTLINYVTFVMWSQKAVTVAALLYLRYTKMPVSESMIIQRFSPS